MRRWVMCGAATVVVAATVGGFLWFRSSDSALGGSEPGPVPPSSAPAASPDSAMMPIARAQVIERQLVSSRPAEVADVLASSIRPAYLKDPVAVLPVGAVLRLDVPHAEQAGQDVLRVPAAVTGPSPGSWVVLMIRESGEWYVLGTDQP